MYVCVRADIAGGKKSEIYQELRTRLSQLLRFSIQKYVSVRSNINMYKRNVIRSLLRFRLY